MSVPVHGATLPVHGATLKRELNELLANHDTSVVCIRTKLCEVQTLRLKSDRIYANRKATLDAENQMVFIVDHFFQAKGHRFEKWRCEFEFAPTVEEMEKKANKDREEEIRQAAATAEKEQLKRQEQQKVDIVRERIKRNRDDFTPLVYDETELYKRYAAAEPVKALWQNQLEKQKEGVLDSAPWRHKEVWRTKLSQRIEQLVRYVNPAGGGNATVASIFSGDMDNLFSLVLTPACHSCHSYSIRCLGGGVPKIDELVKMYNDVCKLSDEELASDDWKDKILLVDTLFDMSVP